MSSFVLKILACIFMFLDHSFWVLDAKFIILNLIGRLAFPIFAFQITEGYSHTKNIKKYILRLFCFALISQIPFSIYYLLVFKTFSINVIFTLLFGVLSILVYDKYNKFTGICVGIFLAVLAKFIHLDYGVYGVIIILLFYIFKKDKALMSIIFIITTTLKYYLINFSINKLTLYYILFTVLTLLPICLYNKKKGRNAKYLFYIFYPAHLLLLSVIYML